MMPSRGPLKALALASITTLLAMPFLAVALEDADIQRTNSNRTLYAIPVPLPYDSLQRANPGTEKATLEQTQFHLWSYISSDYDPSKIKRAVITLHGQGRDAWAYWDDTYDALLNATSPTRRPSASSSRTSTLTSARSTSTSSSSSSSSSSSRSTRRASSTTSPLSSRHSHASTASNNHNATSHHTRRANKNRTSLKRDEVLILAPLFFNNQDVSAYQSLDEEFDSQSLVWNSGDWAEGADSILPDTAYGSEEGQTFEAPKVSSYEALDEVVRWFSDKSVFPNME